jgi:hypothetical protein
VSASSRIAPNETRKSGVAAASVLQRHDHAEIAGRGIQAADEDDDEDRRERMRMGDGKAGRRHHHSADQQQRAQIVARGEESHRQRRRGGAQQCRGGDHADLERIETELGQIRRQNDEGEAVPDAPRRPRRVEIKRVRPSARRHGLGSSGAHLSVLPAAPDAAPEIARASADRAQQIQDDSRRATSGERRNHA